MRRCVFLLAFLAAPCWAFYPAVTSAAGIKLEIPDQPPFTSLDTPRDVPVRLSNTGDGAVTGEVRLGLTDAWRVQGGDPQPFTIPQGEGRELRFSVAAGKGTYRALYPIHAYATVHRGGRTDEVHAVLVVSAEPPEEAAAPAAAAITLSGRGAVPLARLRPANVQIDLFGAESYPLPADRDTDPRSRASWQVGIGADRGGSRPAIGFHPPWSGVKGTIAGDYRVTLPKLKPIALGFGLAIRDNTATEPPSDGVTFRVLVATGGAFQAVFERHTLAKVWEEHSVDLSGFAGQAITLRLLGHPGPKEDTTCDSAFWGNPVLRVGEPPVPEKPAAKVARTARALGLARAALQGQPVKGAAWALRSEAGRCGVAVVPGPLGVLDAQLAFAAAGSEVVIDGFEVSLGGVGLLDLLAGARAVSADLSGRRLTLTHQATVNGRNVPARVVIEPAAGALTVRFDMPGVARDRRGEPRFTHLSLGPSSVATQRLYFGHGYVVTGYDLLSFGYSGFQLSTRFAGWDYANGLSLVAATTPHPDRLVSDRAQRLTSLVASLDATFTLVPSQRGAFAAARVWRGLAGLKPAGGVSRIAGRMVLDNWGGDYAEMARGLRQGTAYGLDDAIFIRHGWQRWGYDYRLPDIYPPEGDRAGFDQMAAAAKLNGRGFALHDNYIDFYPDANGFTYDAIQFTESGVPVKAWWNPGPRAQSYRWLPQAYWPFLERNLKQIKAEIGPDSDFIDVFSAMPTHDYHDRAGNWYPRTVCAEWWGRTFDRAREVLGGPTISEAGHDDLIGHLDAAQSDHGPLRDGGGLRLGQGDWDRVPWFDMGHHGRFIMLAGGLGPRYAGGEDDELHGWGSDDFLATTVLGGRTPMCDGPFYRRTVMTYYLLQPLCRELEHEELLAHAFANNDIHRQQVTWSAGQVAVNRGASDWTVDGRVLPQYGFVAHAGEQRAEISRRDGVISAMAESPGVLFVDARPPALAVTLSPDISARLGDFEDLGGRRCKLTLTLHVGEPAATSNRLFVHVCGEGDLLPGWEPNGDILFQAWSDYQGSLLAAPGDKAVALVITLPEKLKPGKLVLKYGLYDPEHGGARMSLRQPGFGDQRYDGGTLTVTGEGEQAKIAWEPQALRTENARLNAELKVVDFGPAATNGAFRLVHRGDAWRLILLPGSPAAKVMLRLDRLGAKGRKVAELVQIDAAGQVVAPVAPVVAGDEVSFDTAPLAFGYRVKLAP